MAARAILIDTAIGGAQTLSALSAKAANTGTAIQYFSWNENTLQDLNSLFKTGNDFSSILIGPNIKNPIEVANDIRKSLSNSPIVILKYPNKKREHDNKSDDNKHYEIANIESYEFSPELGETNKVQSSGEPDEKYGGNGRVLIMDDEDLVREVVGEMVSFLGYDVGLASDGGEAVLMYKEAMKKGTPYDVVILDLKVPGAIGGKEAIEMLIDIDPKVKAIVSSGYSTDPIMSDHTSYGFKGVMPKPYKMEELRNTLQSIINGDN